MFSFVEEPPELLQLADKARTDKARTHNLRQMPANGRCIECHEFAVPHPLGCIHWTGQADGCSGSTSGS